MPLDGWSERALETLDAAPVGFLVSSPEGRILHANRALLVLVGRTEEDLLGRAWFDVFLTAAGRILVETHLYPALRAESRHSGLALEVADPTGCRTPVILHSVVERDGEGQPRRHAHFLIQRVDPAEGERRLLASMRQLEDTTQELRELTADLERRVQERTAELEAANRELEAFVWAVTHELKAPLRALEGFSRILVQDFGDRLDAEGRDYLARISRTSRSMDRLVGDLLEFARLPNRTLERRPVDVSALAEAMAAERDRAEPGRKVRWEIQPGLQAWADPALFEVVLRNLLSNAWKYTARTEDAVIRVRGSEEAGGQVFQVSDNGAGFEIPGGGMTFRPFQRHHAASEFPGTGLGLSTAQRILARHGGRLEAESRPGEGATFTVRLPSMP